jgi:hypothetical protein
MSRWYSAGWRQPRCSPKSIFVASTATPISGFRLLFSADKSSRPPNPRRRKERRMNGRRRASARPCTRCQAFSGSAFAVPSVSRANWKLAAIGTRDGPTSGNADDPNTAREPEHRGVSCKSPVSVAEAPWPSLRENRGMELIRAHEMRFTVIDERMHAMIGNRSGSGFYASGTAVAIAPRNLAGCEEREDLKVWCSGRLSSTGMAAC